MIWGILLLATIFRLININQSLWLDEASQVLMSQKSLNFIIFERSGDFHPPLSYLIYHFWLMLGSSEIWLRLLPLIFGVATVFIIYKLCQKLFTKKIALISALLLATAPYHIYYSQEIRMYSMAAFFAAFSMLSLSYNKKTWYVLTTIALILTHYMGGFLLLATIFYIWREKKELMEFSKLWGLVILGILPWLPFLIQQLQNGVKADQYLPGWSNLLNVDPLKAIPLIFIKFGIGRISIDNNLLYGFIALLVYIIFGYLILQAIKSKLNLKPILTWGFIPIILTFLISFIVPMNQPFRLLFILPAFYILLAIGIEQLNKYWKLGLGAVLIVSLSGLSFYYLNPKFQREDWRGVTKDIPKNAIFAWPLPFDPYIWYGGKGVGVVKHFPAKENELATNMENAKLGKEVYLFEYLQALSDPNHEIQKWLGNNGYTMEKTLNYNEVGFVYKYKKDE